MNKESDTKFTIKLFYSEDSTDIKSELKNAVMLFVEREVKKVCAQKS